MNINQENAFIKRTSIKFKSKLWFHFFSQDETGCKNDWEVLIRLFLKTAPDWLWGIKMGTLSSFPVAIYQTDKHNCAKQQTQCMAQISKHNGTRTHRLVSQRNWFERLELGRYAENQNGNLRWHLPWRGGGSRGGLVCH